MSASKDTSLYGKVVQITHVYLGPAADRFVSRQVQNHLHKTAEQLTRDDLSHLIDWITAAVSLLTEDKEVVDEYVGQLKLLATTGKAKLAR